MKSATDDQRVYLTWPKTDDQVRFAGAADILAFIVPNRGPAPRGGNRRGQVQRAGTGGASLTENTEFLIVRRPNRRSQATYFFNPKQAADEHR